MKGKGLEIVVLIAPVHDCLNPIVTEPGGKRIKSSSLRWVMNPYDAFSLEAALRLRDGVPGSRVRVITMAPVESEGVIRECLSVGADEAGRIWEEGMEDSDPYATASVLAATLRQQSFDLALCGWRRADLEHSQVGPTLAEFLDLPQVTGARDIQVDREVNQILLQKRVPGFLLKLSCPLPAVITMEKGQPLRYPKYRDRQRGQQGRNSKADSRGSWAHGGAGRPLRFEDAGGARYPAQTHEKERHGVGGEQHVSCRTPSADHVRGRRGQEG